MPNWCYTNISVCADAEKIAVFEKQLNEWLAKDAMENSWRGSWLGNIVINSGIGTVDTGKDSDISCRGNVCYLDNCGEELLIETETAWEPMLQLWGELIRKYIPEATVTFCASEPGCGLFWTNDPDKAGKYVIDSFNNDVESDDEASEGTVISVLQELLHTEENGLEKLMEMLQENDIEDINVGIYKWKFHPLEIQSLEVA